MLRFPALLLPMTLLMLAQMGVLVATAYFTRPMFSFVMVPVIEATFHESALHYPANFYLLRDMFNLFRIPVIVLFGYLMIGWAVFMMIDLVQGRRVRFTRYGTELILSFPSLLAIGLILVGIDVAADYVGAATTTWAGGGAARVLATATGFAALLLKAFFVYSVFYLRYYNRSAIDALRASARFARRRLLLTLMILATAALLQNAVDGAATAIFAGTVSAAPESIVGALVVTVAGQLASLYFVLTSTTYLALERRRR